MTEHAHDTTGHHHGSGHDLDWAEHAASNELEAEVLHALLDQSVTLVADRARADGIEVRRIIDIGPGPGVGTAVLAARFAGAAVIAVDGSDVMLAKVVERVARLGLRERVRTVHGDLPAALDGLGPADLVWASMVLHHIGNERAVLAAIRSLLTPGGLLAVVEFGDPTRFLPDGTATEPAGLQDRLAAAGAEWVARMREELPDAAVSADYPTMLRDAGFELVTDTLVSTHLEPPLSTDARTVLTRQVQRRRDDGSALEPADRAALDALLDPGNPNGIMQRPDVFLDGSRHLYIARATEA